MFIHANAFVGDGSRFSWIGFDHIKFHNAWFFGVLEGRKEGGMNICFVTIVFLV
jgi:hypothetical protein